MEENFSGKGASIGKTDEKKEARNALSILIPTYNCDCHQLVEAILKQCAAIDALDYEIIVGDDASTDDDLRAKNERTAELPHCRCIVNKQNLGRAANRNMLVREARNPWIVFIDGDMMVRRSDFIQTYINATGGDVFYGGYTLGMPPKHGCLRYKYEMAFRNNADVDRRDENRWGDFHTSNFLARCDILENHPIDEHFRRYGYEDVAWGKSLQKAGIVIRHIDNPISFEHFEGNAEFLAKTEEAVATLADMSEELRGYSRLLEMEARVRRLRLEKVVTAVFKIVKNRIAANLKGNNPSLFLFKIYKLGYLLSLRK